MIRTVLAQETEADARRQWRAVADPLRAKLPNIAKRMNEAEADVLAAMAFPNAHRLQIHSTNPLERAYETIGNSILLFSRVWPMATVQR